MQHVQRILETCLCVDDLAVARRFYTEVLGLAVHAEQTDRHLFFRVGNQMLLLFNPVESSKPGTIPPHGTHGAGHVCFAASEKELDAWLQRLQANGVGIESVYHWPQGGRSVYFRDPAGNSLEFATPRIWGIEA